MTFVSTLTVQLCAETFMDTAWAKKICDAWNQNRTLTHELLAWSKNNGTKGYKLIRLYRTECKANSAVELKIAPKGGKALCVSSGRISSEKADYSVDYMMHATTKDWGCMGEGSFGCGAMGAMVSGKLKFNGPKVEAMKVMGPFGAFLRLTGKVPSDKSTCPK